MASPTAMAVREAKRKLSRTRPYCLAPQLKPATGWNPVPKPRITPKGNIMILVDTPTPASTESEMAPAMLLRTMPDTTARPERNMEEEPMVTIWTIISRSNRKQRGERRSTLRRAM